LKDSNLAVVVLDLLKSFMTTVNSTDQQLHQDFLKDKMSQTISNNRRCTIHLLAWHHIEIVVPLDSLLTNLQVLHS